MTTHKQDYIIYRLSKSKEALDDAKLLAKNASWNAAVNRLYYACFYSVSALLLQRNINAQTHTGCKTQFGLHFIKTGVVSIDQGRLYSDLMDWRQKGDYGDMFDFDANTVNSLLEPVEVFLLDIKKLIEAER
jgi:uncharacterized protein